MTTQDSSRDTGSHRLGSSIRGATILLAIFALSIYLTIVDALVPPVAVVAAPDSWVTPPAVAAGPNPPVSTLRSPDYALDQESERVDNSRECLPEAGVDSWCVYG